MCALQSPVTTHDIGMVVEEVAHTDDKAVLLIETESGRGSFLVE